MGQMLQSTTKTIEVREVYSLVGPCGGAPHQCLFHSARPGPTEGGRPIPAYFVRYRRHPPRVPLHLRTTNVRGAAATKEKTPFKWPTSRVPYLALSLCVPRMSHDAKDTCTRFRQTQFT
ncbi:jg19525 [Pararge aegeria aegeria]|uniref:Jg19525 protein n=1 Tax=Pararge aegeria aegeria TaxID=348720 RepID=A0A8S4QIR9_9NEOP|nr:jg19525 [Pararge aegeria aegeria]